MALLVGQAVMMYAHGVAAAPAQVTSTGPVETVSGLGVSNLLPGVLTGPFCARYLPRVSADTEDAPTAEQEVSGQGWNGTGDVSPHSGPVYLNLRCEISVRTCDRRVRGLMSVGLAAVHTQPTPRDTCDCASTYTDGLAPCGIHQRGLYGLSVPSRLHHREVGSE